MLFKQMKMMWLKLLFCGCFLINGGAYGQSGEDWQLVWEDDFNRKDIFSTGIWSKIPRSYKADWCNTLSDDGRLYKIKKGKLVLSGRPNRRDKDDPSEYLTGGIFTKGAKYFGSGRMEVRCKLEGTQGAWPAIWMLPKEAKWPTGGEIDLLERLNYDSFVYQTVHSPYTQKGNKEHPKHWVTAAIRPDDYNVYAVEWDDSSVRFYTNGALTLVYQRVAEKVSEGQYPFMQEPYYLIIDMQLGGQWVGEVKPFRKPVRMFVDWVKYYRKAAF